MYTIRRFENWGADAAPSPLAREAASIGSGFGSPTKVFGAIPALQRNNRQGVSICFLTTTGTDTLYVRIVARGSAIPVLSATNADYVISANQTVPIHCGPGVDLYLAHNNGGAKNYTASEFA